MTRENKKKAKRTIGLLDVLIILAIVGGIFFAVKFSSAGSEKIKGVDIENNITFQVELQKVKSDFADKVAVGDLVYDNKNGGFLGEVIKMEVQTYHGISYSKEEKKFKELPVDGIYNAVVTVGAKADLGERSTMVGNVKIAVGSEMFLRSSNFAGSGYCVGLEKEGGAK